MHLLIFYGLYILSICDHDHVDQSIHISHCQVSIPDFQPCMKGNITHVNKWVISFACVLPISQTIVESSDHSISASSCHIDFLSITCWATQTPLQFSLPLTNMGVNETQLSC